MKCHGINPVSGRPLYSEFVSDFAALEQISLPSVHTILLIVADSCTVCSEAIDRVAERLLSSGLTYVCVWGPDCERVHDIFDWAYIGDGSTKPGFALMSTWHSDESIEEAIWFFITCAIPPDTEIEKTSYLAVAVGNKDWAVTIDSALSDVSAFTSRMVEDDRETSGNVS